MERFWRGAARSLGALLTAFVLLVAYQRLAPPTPSLGNLLAVSKLVAQMALVGTVALIVFRLFARLPKLYAWLLYCTLAFLYYHFSGFEPWGQFWVTVFVIVPASLLGGFLALALSEGKGLPRLGVVLSFGALAYGVVFFFRAGFPVEPPVNAAKLSGAVIDAIDRSNPGEPGSYEVATLTYGSGRDPHRPEFAEGAEIVTESVDGSAFLDGWEGRSGWARTQYWGFDQTLLPLQGRVWFPRGEGPFPLVLIVHGNHSMEDFSDPGYAYLGELLASRGFIFVSVDENFINSSFSSRLDELYGRGLKTENDARGWLLLKHLELWRAWNEDANSRFRDQVDLDRIGLIGHSRGGEAVAVAYAFNALERYPDDASVLFDFGFDIRAVVAIAPVDGQYEPAGRGASLVDANYFVLHGSHDGDVQSFAGSRQFERVHLTGESFKFKSSLYVFGANHGQFNTSWGRSDSSVPYKNVLNLQQLMPAGEQEEIARVYISAFVEAAMNDDHGFLPLFRDARAGAAWLPDTIFLTHYEDSTHRVFADFEEDVDVYTTTLPGGVLEGEHLADWSEGVVELKYDHKGTSAVFLGWDLASDTEDGEMPLYRISLPPGLELTGDDALVFTLSDGGALSERGSPDDEQAESDDSSEASDREPSAEGDEETHPLDFTLEVEDIYGARARLPLSHVSLVQPALEVQVRKSDLFNRTKKSEPVFQSFGFPLQDFIEVEPTLDVTALVEIRMIFDVTASGKVILDNLAFANRSELVVPGAND